MRYLLSILFTTFFSLSLFSQPILSGPEEVCPGDQETYNILNTFYFSLIDFNQLLSDDSLVIRPVDKQQDVNVTGGTIVSYTTADGTTTAVNNSFLGVDIDLSNNPVQACIADAIEDGLSIEQINNCIASINNIQENTIASITVQWDATLDNTCDGNIGFSSLVRREFCEICDPADNDCPDEGEICGLTFQDPSLDVNADLNICIGAQPPVNSTGAGGCLNTTSSYTAVLDQDARQQSNVTYRWYNDGVLVGTSTTETISLNNTYGPDGRAELCVEAVSCNNSATDQFCRFIYPPLSNTAMNGPSCYAPGASAYALIVNGDMNSINSVLLNNNPITNYYFNGSDEINFYAPYTVSTNNSLVVNGIDECGGNKTMYYTFSTSHNCSGNGGGGCPWCLKQELNGELVASGHNTTSLVQGNNTGNSRASANNQDFSNLPSSTVNGVSTEAAIRIFPNPVSERLTIITSQSVVAATIFNANGQMVNNFRKFQPNNPRYSLESRDLKPGIYFLKIILKGGEVVSKQFVKN